MPLEFEKGKIGHVQWVWVDATDFATIESALVQPASCVLFGWLNGNSANGSVVASGSSGLTKSAVTLRSGVMQLAVPTADMSDSQNDFYDRYMFHASLTGAAQIWIPIKGNRVPSSELSNYISNTSDVLSDILSAAVQANSRVLVTQSLVSDVDSQLLLNASVISDIQSALDSDIVVRLSQFSDIMSNIDAVTASVSASDISNIASAIWAAAVTTHGAAAGAFGSLVRNTKSLTSDVFSLLSDFESNFTSRIPDPVLTGSDVASKVWAEKYTEASNVKASTFGSSVRLNMSRISDLQSDLSDVRSDLRSQISGITASVSASDISDIASAVWAATVTTHGAAAGAFGSLVRNTKSLVSDVESQLDLNASVISDAHSAAILAASHASDAFSVALVNRSLISDVDSQLLLNASMISDVQSALDSQFLVYRSDISDVKSELSDTHSDLRSMISGITASVGASDISDIASAVWAAAVATHGAAAGAFGSLVRNTKSLVSDVESQLDLNASVISDAHSAAILAASHASDAFSVALINRSLISDVDSAVSSQFAALSNQLSAFQSDVKSEFDNITTTLSASDISDITSNVWSAKYNVFSAVASSFGSFVVQQTQGASNLLSNISGLTSDAHSAAILAASHASDAASQALLASSRASDAHSMAVANSDAISNVLSMLTAMGGPEHIASLVWDADKGSYVDASSMGSVLQAGTATPSAVADKVWSDFESKVGGSISNVVSFLSTVTSDAHSAAILAASHASNAQSMAAGNSDAISNVLSMLTAMGGPEHIASLVWDADKGSYVGASSMGSVLQAITATVGASEISDIASAVWAAAVTTHGAGAGQFGSLVRNTKSLVSDVESQLDLNASVISDVQSQVDLNASVISDAHSAAILAASHASDAASQALLASSRASDAHSAALVTQSVVSDVQSALDSQFAVLQSSISDIESQLDVGVNIIQISGSIGAADQLELNVEASLNGTASGTPTTTTMVSDVSVTVDDQFKGRIIIFQSDTTTAALRNQATDITAATAASNTLTFTALTTAPVSGDTFVIV